MIYHQYEWFILHFYHTWLVNHCKETEVYQELDPTLHALMAHSKLVVPSARLARLGMQGQAHNQGMSHQVKVMSHMLNKVWFIGLTLTMTVMVIMAINYDLTKTNYSMVYGY